MSKFIRTVIDISDRRIKIFRGEQVRGVIVPLSCDIKDADQLLPEARFARHNECIVMIPRRQVILRQMRLPTNKTEELMDMIGLQLINNIPYPMEDIIYQYQVLDQDSEGYSRVLVIIVPREASQKFMRTVHAVGQDDVKVMLSSYGISKWWALKDRKHPVAIVDLDLHHSEICFCRDDKLYFSRNLSYGREDVINKNAAKLVDEIIKSMDIYQKKNLGPDLEKVVMLLPFEEGKALQGELEERLGIPVQIAGTLEGAGHYPRAVQETLRVNGQHSFTAGMGWLLSNTGDLMNLVPTEMKQEKIEKAFKFQMVKLAGLVMIAVALGVCAEIVDIHKRSMRLAILEDQSRRLLRAQVQEAKNRIAFVERFDQKFSDHVFIPDLLEDLRTLTPEEVSFRTFELDGKGQITLQGYAPDHAGVNQLQSELVKSPRFHDVDLKFATNRRIANKNVMDFKIAAKLTNIKERERWSGGSVDGR